MKALLLIDLQNDYFQGGAMKLKNSNAAVRNAQMVLEAFRAENLPVVHIQHISNRAGASFFLPDSHGAEINDAVKPLSAEKVITKHFPNSFRETCLEEYLRSLGVSEITAAGMMTHVCVDSTVRAAKDLGFAVNLIGDACASKSLEIFGKTLEAKEVHLSFLAALNYFYSTVFTTKNYLEAFNREHSAKYPPR